jgi:uncharacterized protein YdaU (DUF1376 family)
MQLYVAEYLADTTHLNAEQHGAYLLLLMNYWQRGKPLPDLNDRLAIVARSLPDRWNELRTVLAEFFEIRDGFWIHNRMERDLERVKGVSEAGKKAGIASGKARREKTSNGRSQIVQRNANETATKDEPLRTDTYKEQKKQGEVFTLPEWINRDTWKAYVEVRKSKRAAKTVHAWNLVVKQLETFRAKGHDPNAILETSIRSNWTDVYEPKDKAPAIVPKREYVA